MTTIQSVDTYSPAYKAGVKPGELLASINGHEIIDVLDYRFYSADDKIVLETHTAGGKVIIRRVKNPDYEPLGLNFDTYLMDKPKGCANKCVFCFIDQLPEGLRDTLYFKDDDARLSFLQGNYITLTNLSERELDRIIALRISPVHVSVHTTNPELRVQMMGNRLAADIMPRLKRLADGGIELHCQIVVCPGLNDGAELERTIRELPANVSSVSVVPVGLTKHRGGLPEVAPVGEAEANAIIDVVERVNRKGVYLADELFLKAKRELPKVDYYEDFPQFENGVGMLALFESDFRSEIREQRAESRVTRAFSVATGVAAASMFERILKDFPAKVYAVRNDFFGESVDVAGLVTGRDLIAQLKGKDLGECLFIPSVMLRHGGDLFLDSVSLEDAKRELGVPVFAAENDGGLFAEKIIEISR
jgi:putative radical SAM enzyme (TIGR03279 family)